MLEFDTSVPSDEKLVIKGGSSSMKKLGGDAILVWCWNELYRTIVLVWWLKEMPDEKERDAKPNIWFGGGNSV